MFHKHTDILPIIMPAYYQRLRQSTIHQTLISTHRARTREIETDNYRFMPRTRTSTRRQTKQSILNERLFPFNHHDITQRRLSTLQTNRQKYYYYMQVKKAATPNEVIDTLIIARKPKLPKNNRNFGALKIVRRKKITITRNYIPKFVGFEDNTEQVDFLIYSHPVASSQNISHMFTIQNEI